MNASEAVGERQSPSWNGFSPRKCQGRSWAIGVIQQRSSSVGSKLFRSLGRRQRTTADGRVEPTEIAEREATPGPHLRHSDRRTPVGRDGSPGAMACEKTTRIQRASRIKLHLEFPTWSHRRLPVQRTPSESMATRADTTTAIFLRMPTVMRMTGLGRSTIYRLIADQKFPCPVRLGPRAVAWRRSDLDRWSEARPAVTH